jgi:hypothetical protein
MADDGIKAKRDAAAKARRLLPEFHCEDDCVRLLAFAEELESQADALAAEQAARPKPVTQMQMQQGPQEQATKADGPPSTPLSKPQS